MHLPHKKEKGEEEAVDYQGEILKIGKLFTKKVNNNLLSEMTECPGVLCLILLIQEYEDK